MKLSGETKLLLIMAVFVLLGGGTLVSLNMASQPGVKLPFAPTPPPPPPPTVWTAEKFDALLQNAAHTRGDTNAPTTIVEFADFECPSCRRAYNETVKKWETSKAPIRLVFRHFPWSFHERAMPAARAAEAAGKQGKFWPMYDALFEGTETELTNEHILSCAQKVGLDTARFEKDWKDEAALTPLVTADQDLGKKFNINSTPTFVVRDKTGKIQEVTGAAQIEALMSGKPIPPVPAPGSPPSAPAAP